jgi:hypothetical protein
MTPIYARFCRLTSPQSGGGTRGNGHELRAFQPEFEKPGRIGGCKLSLARRLIIPARGAQRDSLPLTPIGLGE